jgi:hypothetical protein
MAARRASFSIISGHGLLARIPAASLLRSGDHDLSLLGSLGFLQPYFKFSFEFLPVVSDLYFP